MKSKISKKIKSREEILATLTKVDVIADRTMGVLVDNEKLGVVEIPDWLWTLCGRTLEVSDTALQTHQFDYCYFDFPEAGEDRSTVPVIYFMDSWVEEVPMVDLEETVMEALEEVDEVVVEEEVVEEAKEVHVDFGAWV